MTMSLAGGVLTVNGTSGNDSIVLYQSIGRVHVSGLTSSYASVNINSVVIKDGLGNDTVSLSGLKAQPWSKPVTLTSTGGAETAKLLDGKSCYFSGSNQQLCACSTGGGTLNGRALDWFDYNVHDAALRQLLRSDFADQAVDRGEMLQVFDQVKTDGTVSSNEYADLKALANSGWLFGSFTYLTDLTRDVVLSNTANAHYQGTALGNLAAGSTGAKLDKLVHKWFLGSDHPNASYSGLTVTYMSASGTLFGASGPQYTDVHQGAVGDCYFVATLGEIALRSPSAIQNMFIVNGDGTYTVRFFNNGAARYVTVDSQLPTYAGGYFLYANMGGFYSDASNVLWVALAEKAYAQVNEMSWLRPATWGGGVNSYSGIEGGYFGDAAHQIENHGCVDYYVNGASDATTLNDAWASGQQIGFASKTYPTDSQIVGNHQYVVVDYDNATQTVTLFNPWGINNNSQYPGLVSLTLSQLNANFDFWSVA